MEIRSYRRVFDLERRIYSIDRLRLNPAGVPVRGIVYFLAPSLLARRWSLERAADRACSSIWCPWYLRDLLLPGLRGGPDGRDPRRGPDLSPRAAARCCGIALERAAGRRLAAGRARRRWYPQDVLVLPDGSDARDAPAALLAAPGRCSVARRRTSARGRRASARLGRVGGRAARAATLADRRGERPDARRRGR